MDACEVCGSHQLEPEVRGGATLLRCGLCDHVAGDPAVIAQMEMEAEAAERGFHPLI